MPASSFDGACRMECLDVHRPLRNGRAYRMSGGWKEWRGFVMAGELRPTGTRWKYGVTYKTSSRVTKDLDSRGDGNRFI